MLEEGPPGGRKNRIRILQEEDYTSRDYGSSVCGNYGSFSLFLLVLRWRVENLIVLRSSVREIVKKSQRKIDFHPPLLCVCVLVSLSHPKKSGIRHRRKAFLGASGKVFC